MNDPAIVRREYATEDRFLARRLSTQAELKGPLVEDAMIAALAEGNPSRVLEVGCGTGDFSERVQRELSVNLVAVDLSKRMAGLTHARGVTAVLGDTQDLPFASARFERVLANRVLYHVPDLGRGLREIARVLESSGRLIAVTYSPHHLGELGTLVGRPTIYSPFNTENGGAELAAHFSEVERQDYAGEARFPDRESILRLLAAYGEFTDVELATRLGDVGTPFTATYRHSLFIARGPKQGTSSRTQH